MTAVLVVGATGVLGAHVVDQLNAGGHQVAALARTAAAAHALRDRGVSPVAGDLLAAHTLPDAVRGADVVIHIATAIPADPQAPGAWLANDRIRIDGTRNLLRASRQADVSRYVQQSITRLYPEHGEDWIDETEPLDPHPPEHLRSALTMEAIVSSVTDIDTVILRGGEFYGAGTGTTERLFAAASSGGLNLDGTGEHFMSPIHPADMAQAVVLAADGTLPSGIFNVVDDQPVRQRDFYAAICALVGPDCHVRPGAAPASVPSRRCSANRLRRFGFHPTYPTYRAGLEAVPMPGTPS